MKILTITTAQLDLYMPHVSDGDVIGILGTTYKVRVIPKPDSGDITPATEAVQTSTEALPAVTQVLHSNGIH